MPSKDVASVPSGYVRTDEFCTTMPGKASDVTRRPSFKLRALLMTTYPLCRESIDVSFATGTPTSGDIAAASVLGMLDLKVVGDHE